MKIFDIPLVSELAHINIFSLYTACFFLCDIVPYQLSKLFDFKFIKFVLSLFFLQYQKFFLLLKFLLGKLSINGFDFLLPEFLRLPSLLLELSNLLLKSHYHLRRYCLYWLSIFGLFFIHLKLLFKFFNFLLLLDKLLMILPEYSLRLYNFLIDFSRLFLDFKKLFF